MSFETAGVRQPHDARSEPALLGLISSSLVRSTFYILHSSFFILHSTFYILHSTIYFQKEGFLKMCPFPGTDGSGKSTFLRQMKIIHDGGFTDEELADIKPDVYR